MDAIVILAATIAGPFVATHFSGRIDIKVVRWASILASSALPILLWYLYVGNAVVLVVPIYFGSALLGNLTGRAKAFGNSA